MRLSPVCRRASWTAWWAICTSWVDSKEFAGTTASEHSKSQGSRGETDSPVPWRGDPARAPLLGGPQPAREAMDLANGAIDGVDKLGHVSRLPRVAARGCEGGRVKGERCRSGSGRWYREASARAGAAQIGCLDGGALEPAPGSALSPLHAARASFNSAASPLPWWTGAQAKHYYRPGWSTDVVEGSNP